MIQTVTQNSVLSQNWVGCTGCTPNRPLLHAHCAQAGRVAAMSWAVSQPVPDRIVALPRPCRGRVVACTDSVAGRVARCAARRVAERSNVLLRAVSQPPRPCRTPPGRIVAHARLCRSIVSRHTQQSGHARSHCLSLRAQVGRVAALLNCVADLPPSRIIALAAHPCLLCHDTIPLYRDPNLKMGNSPFQLPTPFFFSLFFFNSFPFFHLIYWKTTQKIFFFFSFSSRTKNIYFKYFFPILHTVKLTEKKKFFTSTHFFSFNSRLFCPKFFNLLRFYFLLCYLPSIQFNQHNHTSHIIHQNAQWMHDLTRSHRALGIRIPKL